MTFVAAFFDLFDVVGKVIQAITKPVSVAISKVFNWAFENLLQPILESALKFVWDFILMDLTMHLSWILEKIENLLIDIINAMVKAVGILIGARQISHNGENTTILEAMLRDKDIKNLFLGIVILSITLVGALSLYAMLKTQLDFDVRQKRTAARVARSVLQASLTFASGYAFVTILVLFGKALIDSLDMIISVTVGATDKGLGSILPMVRDAIVSETDWQYEILGYVGSILCGVLLLLTLLRTALSIVRRIYDTIILFITQPFYAASIVLDDGETYKRYRNFFVGRMFIGIGTYVSLLLMANLWMPFINGAEIDSGTMILDMLLKVLLIYGGIKSCENVPSLLGQIIGDHAAMVDLQARTKFDQFLPFNLGRL